MIRFAKFMLLGLLVGTATADFTVQIGDVDGFVYNGLGSSDHAYIADNMMAIFSPHAQSQLTPMDSGMKYNRVAMTFLFDPTQNIGSAYLQICHKRFEPGFQNAHVAWFEPYKTDTGGSSVAVIKGFAGHNTPYLTIFDLSAIPFGNDFVDLRDHLEDGKLNVFFDTNIMIDYAVLQIATVPVPGALFLCSIAVGVVLRIRCGSF